MNKILCCTVFNVLCCLTLFSQSIYNIDVERSKINWTGSNLFNLGSHEGTVKFKNGELAFQADTLAGGRFAVDMESIVNTDGGYNEGLVNHLKEDDFFGVSNFPESILTITKVQYTADNKVNVEADLTIKGITHSVNFESTVLSESNLIKFHTLFFIDRTKWEVRYGSKSFFKNLGDNAISDAIKLEVVVLIDKC